MQASVQVEQALTESFAIHGPRDAVDARRCVALQRVERTVQHLWRNVVEQRSETLLRVSLCCSPYPDRRSWGTLARRWVRRVLWRSGFPLVEALSSGDSAGTRAPLFAALTGRMASSDFFKPFIIGFGLLHSLRGPTTTSGAV